MRSGVRRLLPFVAVFGWLFGNPSFALALCGTSSTDAPSLAAAEAAADAECDCCRAQTTASYLRCVARVAKAAVHAGALRRACKSMVVHHAAALPCPLRSGQTTTPSPCQLCNSDADCPGGEFCECRPGTCDKTGGTCTARPAVCFDLVAPVCGCDGKTYPNDCERRAAGVCKQANGPCGTGQCFNTVDRQCTGQACSAAQRCPLPNELCVPACPPPLPGGTCFNTLDGQCTGQPCTPSAPCQPNEVCLTECPPPSGVCFDTVTRQCTGEACSSMQTCSLPNEICTPLCPPPPPPTTTTTTTVPGETCQTDADCGADQFCECPAGTCSKSGGTCTTKPAACPDIFAPVCGCDGMTYPSDCSRQAAAACKLHDGACLVTCQTSADCNDGNPCTVDECVNGTCVHLCVCVSPGGALTCCPGPSTLCTIPPSTTTTTTLPGPLRWFYSCGDPVCGGHTPHPGVSPCSSTEVAGAACSPAGLTCDPGDSCNRLLVCATSDPTQGGMCPISRRAAKENIQYLSAADGERLRDELMKFRLATYEYKAETSRKRHLGFIIDDVEPSAAIDPGRDMVDLYGYTSMAVAALQAQAHDISVLKKEVARLRHALRVRRVAGSGTAPSDRK